MDPETTWAKIRKHVAGWKIVVVSNRVDKPLKKTLERLFGVKLRWVVARTRKIGALEKSVRDGNDDMVIAFTSFFDHKYDGMLSQASRRNDHTLYVRAGTGRPTAVMLALARDLVLK